MTRPSSLRPLVRAALALAVAGTTLAATVERPRDVVRRSRPAAPHVAPDGSRAVWVELRPEGSVRRLVGDLRLADLAHGGEPIPPGGVELPARMPRERVAAYCRWPGERLGRPVRPPVREAARRRAPPRACGHPGPVGRRTAHP